MTFAGNIIAGVAIGCVPTGTMLLGSLLLLYCEEASPVVEAALQNFCAGLILAALGTDLFPMMRQSGSVGERVAGVTIGMVGGLLLITMIGNVVEYFESGGNDDSDEVGEQKSLELRRTPSGNYQSISAEDGLELPSVNPEFALKVERTPSNDEAIEYSQAAMRSVGHKNHVKEHLQENLDMIMLMNRKSQSLLTESDPFKIELLVDELDKDFHLLQYQVHHCRRLIQGAECNACLDHDENKSAITKRVWQLSGRKEQIRSAVQTLYRKAEYLVRCIDEEAWDVEHIHRLHVLIDAMDDDIEHSERRVETNFYQWRRRVTSVAVPKEGSKIQSSLIIPVVIDCIVDGFLLGVSVSLSLRAGVILALATSFEMCFLGMAVATRVRKCTASTKAHRLACIILPPFVITLGSLLGVSVGTAAYAFPVVLIAFVAFGIVALLHLVTTELLEEAMEHRDNIWVPASIFVGVFLVVLIDQVTPEGMDMQAQTMEHFTQ